MDISNRFSLVDFLAFLFPGVLGASGIFVLLLFTPVKDTVTKINFELSFTLLFFVLSYIMGVILSGISEMIFRSKMKRRLKDEIFISDYRNELLTAFNSLFCKAENRDTWNGSNFYLCRSLVTHFMPNVSEFLQRQSSLRQLKMNLIPTVVLWLIIGIVWGIQVITTQNPFWGILVIVGSIVISSTVIYTLYNRMIDNEIREVREVQTAFLAGYSTGIFLKNEKGVERSKRAP